MSDSRSHSRAVSNSSLRTVNSTRSVKQSGKKLPALPSKVASSIDMKLGATNFTPNQISSVSSRQASAISPGSRQSSTATVASKVPSQKPPTAPATPAINQSRAPSQINNTTTSETKLLKPINKSISALQPPPSRPITPTSQRSTSAISVSTNYSTSPLSYEQQAVKVIVRIRNANPAGPAASRPVTPDIGADGQPSVCLTKTGTNKIDIVDPTGEKGSKPFNFDVVFGMEAQQEEVYGVAVEPLIRKCLEGYNGCIFAYGQTAAGKTHTMQGPANKIPESLSDNCKAVHPDIGIISRVVHQLNNHVKDRRGRVDEASGNCLDYVVKVSYLEIYNESLIDLLVDKDKQEDLKIRMEPDSVTGKDLYVQNLSERYIGSLQDYLKVLTIGSKNRSVGETNMNAQSSRSHAILTITIDQYLVEPKAPQPVSSTSKLTRTESSTSTWAPEHMTADQHSPDVLQKIGQGRKRSKIHLIDLAGSERADSTGATGDRLKEGAQINQSLSALGNVISALTSPGNAAKKHIPYRDSKLTYLLSDSLGGNALTLMITCCSPAPRNYSESVSTLRFAERVKKVVNKAVVNMDPYLLRIAELEAEVLALKKQLENCTCGGRGGGSACPNCHGRSTSKTPLKSRFRSPMSPVAGSMEDDIQHGIADSNDNLSRSGGGKGKWWTSIFSSITTKSCCGTKRRVDVDTVNTYETPH
ncbi:Kinesin-like protein kif3a [Rhizoclosmatium sp. JEL0117]|nr:Kinesin-like protein kif3a [Rhizoclosmatium sp. JEL0117]